MLKEKALSLQQQRMGKINSTCQNAQKPNNNQLKMEEKRATFTVLLRSKKTRNGKYVRSRHALLKALTRPFLGVVLTPKSKSFYQIFFSFSID